MVQPTLVAPVFVPLVVLTPAPWNPRTIKDERFQNLCRSLEADPDFLQLRPILATADGTIFAGNMRFRAAQHLGWETIPAVLVDIPEPLARERPLRDNAQWGEWEDDELATLLASLKEQGSDLDLLGLRFEDDIEEVLPPGVPEQELQISGEPELNACFSLLCVPLEGLG